MARPVVAAQDCVKAIHATVGEELILAMTAQDYVQAIHDLLQQPGEATAIGAAGRQCIVQRYSWAAHLAGIDRYLPGFDPSRDTRADRQLS